MAGNRKKKVATPVTTPPKTGPDLGAVWGVPAQQVFQGLPGYPEGLPKTEAGLMRYLLDGGMTPDKYLELATGKDSVAAMQAFVNDPQSGFSYKPTQPQDAPAGGEGGKPKAPKKPPSRKQMQDFTGGFVRGVAEGGTDIKRATVKTPWGEVEVRNRRPAPQPASEQATGGSGESATAQQQGPREPVTLPPLEEQIQAKVDEYARRGKVAPQWTGAMQFLSRHSPTLGPIAALGGATVLGGMGYAAVRNHYDKKAQPAPTPAPLPPSMSREESDQLDRMMDELHRIPTQPAIPDTPPAQPPANPAGTAPPPKTTLLHRIMSSREYA